MLNRLGVVLLALALALPSYAFAEEAIEAPAESKEGCVLPTAPEEMNQLDWFVGCWKAEVAMPANEEWKMPESKSAGVMCQKPVLNGMYHKMKYHTTEGAMDYQGGGMLRWDAGKKAFVSWWFDVFGVESMMTGGPSEDGKTWTYEGGGMMNGAGVKQKQVVTITSDTSYTEEFFEMRGEATEWQKCMTAVYTKVKPEECPMGAGKSACKKGGKACCGKDKKACAHEKKACAHDKKACAKDQESKDLKACAPGCTKPCCAKAENACPPGCTKPCCAKETTKS